MKLFTQLTGLATLLITGIFFVMGDVVMLVVLTPLVLALPKTRTRALGRYAQFIARTILGVLRTVGGAHFEPWPVVPAHGGVLMVMNHQSVIDIPLAVASVPSGYPRMVARARYGHGIPLVSHMISLYGHILVQPGRTGRSELEGLAETARASALPILIYPEGHRTQDGEIGRWKRGGLDAILSAREWEVYVLVVDGLWRVSRLNDFIRNLSDVRCCAAVVGPFRYDGRGREHQDEFVSELRQTMCAKLAQMRADANDSQTARSLVLSDQ